MCAVVLFLAGCTTAHHAAVTPPTTGPLRASPQVASPAAAIPSTRIHVVEQPATSTGQSPKSASTAAQLAKVPPLGDRVPGEPYGVSGGRAVDVAFDTGFGLRAAPPTAVPRRSMANAYALFLASAGTSAGPGPRVRPTISLALATQAHFKPSHDALVWIVRWPGICVAAAPATFLKRDHEPTAEPCQNWYIVSDTTGQPVWTGSG